MSKYILRYSADSVDSPVLSRVVLSTGSLLNILKAEIGYEEATIVIEIIGGVDEEKKVIRAFKRYGIDIKKLEENIVNDLKKCVDCGACISICPVSAICFDGDWSVKIDNDKCIRCGMCVEVCPRRSLSIRE